MTTGDEMQRVAPSALASAVRAWADGFARAVRERDYERGRAHFSPDVISCGTRSHLLEGLDDLVSRQWRGVWERTRGFAFTDIRVVDWQLDGDERLAVVLAQWSSTAHERGGEERHRVGRATLILRSVATSDRTSTGPSLRCVHSHFSLQPTEWADTT